MRLIAKFVGFVLTPFAILAALVMFVWDALDRYDD